MANRHAKGRARDGSRVTAHRTFELADGYQLMQRPMYYSCLRCRRGSGAFVTQQGMWPFPDGTPVWQCANRRCSAFNQLQSFQHGGIPEGAGS